MLDNYLAEEIASLRAILAERDLVLLDYETNADVYDLRKPLSHASLVVRYLNGDVW